MKAGFLAVDYYLEKLNDLLLTGIYRVDPTLEGLMETNLEEAKEIITKKLVVVNQNKVNRYYFDGKHILTMTNIEFIERDKKIFFVFRCKEETK